MKRDPLAALKLADPARRVDLDAVDDRAFETLRQAITMTPGTTPQTPRTKRGRRIVAIAAATTVLGGGVAYATYSTMFAGGASDGLTCMAAFVDPDTLDRANNPTFGGVKLTADPVADCVTYAREAGVATIKDPVAFRYKGFLVVAPADQVPQGAERLLIPGLGDDAPASDAAAGDRVRLAQALDDLVDRPAGCMTAEQARAFAAFALRETGLTGWTVDAEVEGSGECVWPLADGAQPVIRLRSDSAELERNVPEQPKATEDPKYARIDAQSASMREALRTGISEGCLNLTDARKIAEVQARESDRVVREVLGAAGAETPVIGERDDALACSTVDIKPGGAFTVVVRGPQTAKG
ncbi:MAG: hypothetical protein QM708_06000 [Propioniciclava sp.]|uniref:hypothetical protein n=1 Tax=Propioniciclava sp. TaxID=2038686 RepID=UPI0039E5E262